MSRRILLSLCALFFGGILSLAFLEVALRIYNPIVETVKGDRVVVRANYDEIRKNAGIPGVAPESHIHQNSLGFRGADPPADLANRLSIITVGGSTTRSGFQSDDRTWTALLGDAVADCFDRTWINNAGFDGHTSFAHADLIRKYIDRLHPRVVVLLIGANELYADALPAGAAAHERERIGKDLVFGAGLKGFLMHLAQRSEALDLALTLYRSVRAWQLGFTSGGWTEGDPMPSDVEAKLGAARDGQPAYTERLQLIIRLLREGQTIPVLLTQPTLGGIGRDPTTGKDLSRLWYGQFYYQIFDIYNETMRREAQNENVYLIDLARLLPKDTKYYVDIMHYSDAGSAKVAELVMRGLLPYLEQKFPSFNKGTCQIDRANPA